MTLLSFGFGSSAGTSTCSCGNTEACLEAGSSTCSSGNMEASLFVLRNLMLVHISQICFLGLIHCLLDIDDGLHVSYVTDLVN